MKGVLREQRRKLLEEHPHLRHLADHLERVVQLRQPEPDAVSIVITCKNKVSSLPYVLRRIGEQSRRPEIVVLADDASTDNSVSVFISECRRLGLRWRLAALPAGGNYRLNTLRNRGFEHALDGIVMLIDGDLILSSVYVERHRRLHLDREEQVASMGPRFEYAYDDLSGPVNFMWGYGAEQQGIGRNGYLPAWQRAHGAVCIRRSVWCAVGGFDEAYNGKYGIDDIDFLFRLFMAGVYPISDFEGYCIHIPHDTTFDPLGRDPRNNIGIFCEKYGVPETILGDPINYSALHKRNCNWSLDFA